jgi:hypothetical protein
MRIRCCANTRQAGTSARFLSWNPRSFFACFRQTDCDRLLAAFHLTTLAGSKRATLSAPHRALNRLARAFAVFVPSRAAFLSRHYSSCLLEEELPRQVVRLKTDRPRQIAKSRSIHSWSLGQFMAAAHF